MHRKLFLFIAALLFVMNVAFADDDKASIKIIPSGFAYYQIGQIEHETPNDPSLLPKTFDQHFNGRLTLEAVIQDKLRIIVGGEAQLGASIGGFDQTQIKLFLLKEAQGIYTFTDQENSVFQLSLAAGYFPFKYNPEARNLGEYLFRTGSYPGYVITDFDFAKARLMGFNLSATLFQDLQLSALFTSEYVEPPYFDYSLAFVAGYKFLNKIIDVGAGIDFDRILPISPDVTTDPAAANRVTDNQNNYVVENGDTLHYTKQGTKLMGRITFDPKPLLPFADIMGPDDGKLYGEMAILGTKNYGALYSDVAKRMPMMFGFNIPCFKMIDVVSFEFEYYGCDTTELLNIQTSPNKATPDVYPAGQKRSLTKWSFYAQKTIAKGWAVKGLIGRDHYRGLDQVGNYDAIERMNGPEDWHYNLRIMYSF
jgi:hypothetical protein